MSNEQFVKLLKRLQKENPEFVASVESMSLDELKKEISLKSQQKEEVKASQKEDEQLNEAKELVKELNAPYRESLKALSDKITFIYLTMKNVSGE